MTSPDDEHPGPPWLHGVAARFELLAAGTKPTAIQARIESGRYLRIHTGVYAIGHKDLTVYGRRRAIVLACGKRAVLSHRSAADAWGLRPGSGAMWDVTVRQTGVRRPHAPVNVFRYPTLRAEEIDVVDGIPITTVSRTLLDISGLLPIHHLRRAIERAVALELFDLGELQATIERHPRRLGRPKLVALLEDLRDHGLPRTRSDIEAAFLQLCIDHDLPRPQVNQLADEGERDFRWPAHLLIVEVDGWAHHRGRTAFTADRRRDRAALRAGFRVARFTATEIDRDPAGIARELRVLLGLAA
jgi:very-short-patch-repair endonuclease